MTERAAAFMNILFDSKAFERQSVGGVSRYFVELVRHLRDIEGCHPQVLAPLHINRHLAGIGVPVVGRRVPHIPFATPVLRRANLVLSRLLTRNSSADLVHETYYSKWASAPTALPRVTTVYDMIHELFPQYFTHFDTTSRNKRVSVARADAVICISETTRADLIERFGIHPEKVFAVPLANSVVAHGAAPSRPGKPYILYVGHRSGYKNFALLLEAYAADAQLRKDLALVCFGGGGPAAREWSAIRAAGLQPGDVQFRGGDDAALADCYAWAQVHVCTSLYEGFGLTVLEAMSNGCPVVAAQAGSLPEVGGGAALYFDPRDPGSLAEALRRMVYGTGMRERSIAAGREQAGRFSWTACAAKTHAVYRKVLGR